MFITSTILDFAKVFTDPVNADLMTASLLDDLCHYGAELWAFVVMGHHIHLLAIPADGMSTAELMARIKANAGRRIEPHLCDEIRKKLSIQKGLNRRSLWKRSFRGLRVFNSTMFDQKVNYIHMNPVRAGLCTKPEDYRWSSCWMYEQEKFDWDRGLLIDDELIRHFCDPELLRLGVKGRRCGDA